MLYPVGFYATARRKESTVNTKQKNWYSEIEFAALGCLYSNTKGTNRMLHSVAFTKTQKRNRTTHSKKKEYIKKYHLLRSVAFYVATKRNKPTVPRK